jgi:3-aminobutyryl-CoA ammonia-lyase
MEINIPSEKCMIRLRVGLEKVHYGGNLVDGAFTLGLFGDLATELLIRLDGDEGLFLRYDEVEFLAPLYGGDYVEAIGLITEKGRTSRRMNFKAYRVVTFANDPKRPSAASVLDPPQLYCRALGVCVTPADLQQNSG